MWLYTYMLTAVPFTLNLMYLIIPKSGQYLYSELSEENQKSVAIYYIMLILDFTSKFYTAWMVLWSFLYLQLYQIVIVYWLKYLMYDFKLKTRFN